MPQSPSLYEAYPTRALSVNDVLRRIRCSRGWLYILLRKDSSFPRPFKRGRRTFFVEAEIERWLQAQIEASRLAVPMMEGA